MCIKMNLIISKNSTTINNIYDFETLLPRTFFFHHDFSYRSTSSGIVKNVRTMTEKSLNVKLYATYLIKLNYPMVSVGWVSMNEDFCAWHVN